MSKEIIHDELRGLDGIFVGLLSDREVAAFDELCRAGKAHRSYEGAAGFMCLAKVRFVNKAERAP